MAAPDESVVHGSKASPKDLPALDRLLRDCAALVAEHGRTLVANEARALLDGLRARAVAGQLPRGEVAALPQALSARVHARMQPNMRAVLTSRAPSSTPTWADRCWPMRPCSRCWR